MHITGTLLTAVVFLVVPWVGGVASAATPEAAEPEPAESVQTAENVETAQNVEIAQNAPGGESAKDPAGGGTAATDTAAPAAAASPAPGDDEAAPGFEQIIIQAGESDATSDYDTGDSVTGFDASDLEALGAQSVADLAAFTPNLEIVTSGATTPTFFIRGVGLNDFNANSAGAVALYQDDVQINAPAMQLANLFDMEAVNVLRGPQGKGGFRSASAGAIKLYSRKPSGEFGGYLRSSYGNYDYQDYEGAIEAPMYEDILAGRFAFRLTKRDGFVENRCGDAPLIKDRPVKTTGAATTSAPFSICGEKVTRVDNPVGNNGKSPIAEGLPSKVNNLDNYAVRGSFVFQPTLDMEWFVTAQYSSRTEQARLGQAYGTNISTNATLPGPGNISVQRFILGGPDSEDYIAPEVRARVAELTAQGRAAGLTQAQAADQARLQTGVELAGDLDDEPWAGDFDRVGPLKNHVFGASVQGHIQLTNSILLTSIFGFNRYDRLNDVDLDFSPNVLFEIETNDKGRQLFSDIHLSGVIEDRPIRWEVGGYFLKEKLDVEIFNRFPATTQAFAVGSRDYTQKLRSAAGWGSFGWDFWEDFTLDGGVRYNWETKLMDYSLTVGGVGSMSGPRTDFVRDTWQDPTGEIRLTYRFREDTHAYWKYTRGWKGGHFNATTDKQAGVVPAEPERIDAFEMGMRGSWFDGRLGLDLSLFHYDYENYQIFTAEQQLGAQPQFVIINANDAEVYGSEIDLTARPWTGAFLQVRGAWLESQFLDFVQVQSNKVTTPQGINTIVDIEINNTGNRLLNSPQFKISLTAEQALSLGPFGSLSFRWDGAWTDDTNFDATAGRGIPNGQGVQFLPENTIGQRAFWLHNLSATYVTPNGAVQFTGWVRNLTNKAYKTFAFDGSTFNQTTIYFVGDPRTYGASVTATF